MPSRRPATRSTIHLALITSAIGLGSIPTGACGNPRPSPGHDGPPSLVLIGLDGYRWDYIERPQAKTLKALAEAGVRAERIVPSFPSTTFPNAYTLVTGLYPANHGILGNKMIDRTDGARFAGRDSASVTSPRWWGGEPIWTTAIRQGRRAIVIQWAGSKAAVGGVLAENVPRLAGRAPNQERIQQIVQWLSLPPTRRPALIAAFLLDVDQAGHRFGPDSPEVDDAIARVDEELAGLQRGLARAGLVDRVNLVIVADHGMTNLDPTRQIFLDRYIDREHVEVVEASPVGGLVPEPGHQAIIEDALRGRHPHLSVYRPEELPARWHYTPGPRTPPLIIVADEGWLVTAGPAARQLGGDHGFDPAFLSMSGIFVAHGPAFKTSHTVPPFQNVHVYGLLARTLGLEPAANDGSPDSVQAIFRAAEGR